MDDYVEQMQQRIKDIPPVHRAYYSGISDAGFWSSASTPTYVTTICIPETVYLPEPTGHLSWDFDPAALWDIIAWSDDGHICNMRVAPYDPMQYNPRIDFWTSESDNVPSNIVTQGREDFIDRFKECVEINNTRYGYIAGSNK